MTRLIDMYASQHDIAESSVAFVDAEPAEVLEVLERVDLSGPGIDAAAALGLTGDITFGPERIELWGDREQLYGLTWRVRGDEPGYVAVVWDVRVEAGAEGGTMLSSTRRFIATDTASRDRLGTAWPIVGPLTT
ncbi:MAG: hypothetical protein QOI80_2549, partial [Solirubrobacteraceae bacterium]|nr:hypothetical protein [Solirubrobacteraceae bacterium]